MTTVETTQGMFDASGALSAGSMLKSLGVHVFMLGLVMLLPAQALLRPAPPEKNDDIDVVFYRPPEAAVVIPEPAPPEPRVEIAAPRGTVAAAPVSRPRPNASARPDVPPGPPAGARVEVQPQPVARTGILAFKDQFASVASEKSAPPLGAAARYGAVAEAVQPSARSMLATGSPGSSGGIDAASLNRSVGGGGGGNASAEIPGVAVGRATSTIASIAAEDRPKPQRQAVGFRTDEEIQIVFDRYKASFYRLYNRALRSDPTLKGQMVLRLTIEPDGSVSLCKLQSSDLNAPDLADQVMNITRTINFGAKGGQAVTIVYPIDFLPAA